MLTILGAGGAIATPLIRELAMSGEPVRLVNRKPQLAAGATETQSADLTDLSQTVTAVSGSSIAFLLAGLKYDLTVWREYWPRVMSNTIEACKRANTKLIFFDNVYMYGKVDGRMTEETPFNPCSRKGEIRAALATQLLREIKTGNLTAMIVRSPDFYGPRARAGLPNVLVFDPLSKGNKANWLANDRVPHSFAFTPDAAKSLALLANASLAWNQTWHVPAAEPAPDGKQFVELVANELAVRPRYRVLNKPMIKVMGWFNSDVRELYEMLYQNDRPYLFDSSKFAPSVQLQGDALRRRNSYHGRRIQSLARRAVNLMLESDGAIRAPATIGDSWNLHQS